MRVSQMPDPRWQQFPPPGYGYGPPPPPPPPSPPKRRTAATVVWCLLLAAAVLAASMRGAPSASAGGSAAASMVGTDGLTTRYVAGDQFGSSTWSRTTGGVPMASSGPDAFGWWVVLTDIDQATADLARFSWTTGADRDASYGDELYSLTGGEVRRQALSTGRTGVVYRGGLLELPADVRDGSTWTSQGALVAMTDGALGTPITYTSKGSATRAADGQLAGAGCLDVVVTETVQGAAETSARRTWCPGKGIVAFTVDGRAWTAAAPSSAMTVSVEPGVFDWSRGADLTFTATSLSPDGPVATRSSSLLSLLYLARPALLPNGVLVAAVKQNSDLVAIDPGSTTGSRDHTVWRAHPGGVIVTCATLGDVTVAVTTDRRISAYGPTGLALWSVRLPDTSTTRPVSFGGHIVVSGVDGSVTALDPATGEVAWHVSMPGEIQVRPVVSGDTLVVIDESGAMAAIDPDGNQVWQNTELPASSFAVSAGVLVVSERGASTVRGYDLATGTKLWRVWEPNLLGSLADLGGTVVGYSSTGLIAYDPATGTQVWSRPGQLYDGMSAGDRYLVLTATRIQAIDSTGAVTAEWEHHVDTLEQSTGYLMVTGTAVAVATSRVVVRGVVS